MHKTISTERLEAMHKAAEKHGFTRAPKDHPIYSEGPSIMFLRHTYGQSQAKGSASHQTGLRKHTE